MPARAVMIGWVRWVGCLGLLVAFAAARPAAASTCHVPDRPILGIEPAGFAPTPLIPATLVDPASTPPGYRSVPCPDDPATRPDHSSHLIGWLAPPPLAGRLDDSPRRLVAPRRVPPPGIDRDGRLERPPRRLGSA